MSRFWSGFFDVNTGLCRYVPWLCPCGHLHTHWHVDQYMQRHTPWLTHFLKTGMRDDALPHWVS